MTSMQYGHAVADTAPGLDALVAKHKERLDAALAAIAGRGYWSAYPEAPSPREHGEGTAEAGRAAFDPLLGQPFPLAQPGPAACAARQAPPPALPLHRPSAPLT